MDVVTISLSLIPLHWIHISSMCHFEYDIICLPKNGSLADKTSYVLFLDYNMKKKKETVVRCVLLFICVKLLISMICFILPFPLFLHVHLFRLLPSINMILINLLKQNMMCIFSAINSYLKYYPESSMSSSLAMNVFFYVTRTNLNSNKY